MNERTTKARKWIVAGVSAGALAGGVAGFMVTVPGGAGAATSGAVVQVADTGIESVVMPQHHGQPHLGPEERAAKFAEVLQSLVDDGTITTAERDTVIATLQAARPDRADGEGGRGGRGGRHLGAAVDTAASVIGVTAEELKAALQNGSSIAEVATANGVDPQTVIDALVADATANLTQRITDMVNGVRPADAPADPAS
jgi:hypothetical protein